MWTTKVKTAIKSRKAVIAAVSVLSSVSGAAAGYIVATKRLELKYTKMLEEELDKTRQYYAAMQKPATPQEALREVLEKEVQESPNAEEGLAALRSYQGVPIKEAEKKVAEEAEPMVEEHNIFSSRYQQVPDDPDPDWDYDEQMALRAELVPGTPYIIHHDEYYENSEDYEQVALTYFLGDDVLIDEKDVPIEDVERVVAEDNLTRFGFGSKDNSMLYIRNDRMECLFEISMDDGSYAQKVLGFEPDDGLKHSDRRPRKFRDYDE